MRSLILCLLFVQCLGKLHGASWQMDAMTITATTKHLGSSPNGKWKAYSIAFKYESEHGPGFGTGFFVLPKGARMDERRSWETYNASDSGSSHIIHDAVDRHEFSKDGRYLVAIARNGAGHQPYATWLVVMDLGTGRTKAVSSEPISEIFDLSDSSILTFDVLDTWPEVGGKFKVVASKRVELASIFREPKSTRRP